MRVGVLEAEGRQQGQSTVGKEEGGINGRHITLSWISHLTNMRHSHGFRCFYCYSHSLSSLW